MFIELQTLSKILDYSISECYVNKLSIILDEQFFSNKSLVI